MFSVYILLSLKDNKTYVGYSDNIERRLKEHNSGRVVATKHRRPLKVLFTKILILKRKQKDVNYGGKVV